MFYKVFGRGSATGSLKSGNGDRASSARLVLVAALLGFVVFAISSLANPERALAIDCTGIPHHEAGTGNENIYFNADTGTCATQTSGGVAPVNGFRWYTNYETFGASATFYGTFGTWANCALTASGPAAIAPQNLPASCASGPALANIATSGTYDLEWTVTETVGRGGTSYVVKMNITTVLTLASEEFTINSMSITGGAFDAPGVTISGVPANTSGVTPFNVTMQFTETVTGFTLADIAVGNGVASNFVAVDGDTYTATITPTNATGDVTVTIAAGAAQDLAGLDNAAASASANGTIVEDTQKVIASFMMNRANHILSNQADISGFVSGTNIGGGGPLGRLQLNGNEGGQTLSFSTSRSKIMAEAGKRLALAFGPKDEVEAGALNNNIVDDRTGSYDIWTEINGSRSSSGSTDSSLWVGQFGAHYFVSNNVLLGGLLQLDWADETNANAGSRAEGKGWMIGPYIAGRFPNQNIFYEVRASWGRSDNDVTPLGTYTDNFETERLLASGKISGVYKLEAFTFEPSVRISYFEETQETYTDNLSNVISEQTISLGEIRFGPRISKMIKLDNGTMFQPSFGITGVWNFGMENNTATQGFAIGNDDLRARVDAGLSFADMRGWMVTASGYYDGIGIDDYDSYGGRLRLVIPLN